MSFWDNVKKFAQPYADDDYEDYDEDEEFLDEYEEPAEAPARRSPRRAPAPTPVMEQEEEEEEEYGFTPVAAAPASTSVAPSGFTGTVLGSTRSIANKQEVVLFHAKAFDDAAKAADELRNRRAVILNMENVDKALTRRVVDFLSGCVYALDGQVKKVAQSTYLFCPHNMDVVGDLENIKTEAESYV